MTGDLSPTTTGTFSQTPFAHILIYLYEKRLSGTLDIRCRNAEVNVYFRDGTPAKVQTDVPRRGLGHVLLVFGQITEPQLLECNARIQEKGGLQGKTLIDLGYLDVNGLMLGLKKQLVLKLTDIFAMNDGTFEFYNNVNKLEGFGPDEIFPVHPYTVVMSGLRTYADKLDFSSVLSPLQGKWISLHPEMEKIRAFRLSTVEKTIIQYLLQEPRRYPDLLTAGRWTPALAQYTLYGLRITRLLGIDETKPDVLSGEPSNLSLSSIPPLNVESEDPEIARAKKELLDKAQEIASQTYYEMLEVDPKSATEDIRRAFFVMSKKFHPDRLHQDLRISLREAVHYVFSNITEAHTILSDPGRREEYDKKIFREKKEEPSTSDEHREVRDALEAENLFQRAVVFLNKGEIDKALELVQSALILSPNEGEHLALSAHLQVLKRPSGTPLIDLEKKLRNASAHCPRSEKVTFYLADVLKRQGKLSEAKGYYKKVLELNARNINAAREIRLIEMKDKNPTADSNSFIKRFFK